MIFLAMSSVHACPGRCLGIGGPCTGASRPRRGLGCVPLNDVDLDSLAVGVALLGRLSTVPAVLELDEEGFWVVVGDGNFSLAQPKLLMNGCDNLWQP